jgi:hypothetical protein
MSYSAKVFRILIASPSDVIRERALIAEAFTRWNSGVSPKSNVVLQPIFWNLAAVPRLGPGPQPVLNPQIVDNSDARIGVFWTRLGTPTGVADSGTVEEIERIHSQGKPVSLYFSNIATDPSLDLDQKRRLDAFKQQILLKGFVGNYSSYEEFVGQIDHAINALGHDLAGEPPILLEVGRPQYPDMGLYGPSVNQIAWGYSRAHAMTPDPTTASK